MIQPLEPLDRSLWLTPLGDNPSRFACWVSRDFIVQAFTVPGGVIRLAINRRQSRRDERLFEDGISWDELQEIKQQCGYGDRMAVEIYPENCHVLNQMNARHLWILPHRLPFAWTIDPKTGKVNREFLAPNPNL